VEGHGFSRAVESRRRTGLLAPEVRAYPVLAHLAWLVAMLPARELLILDANVTTPDRRNFFGTCPSRLGQAPNDNRKLGSTLGNMGQGNTGIGGTFSKVSQKPSVSGLCLRTFRAHPTAGPSTPQSLALRLRSG
jgi:hypothetical protein